MMATIRRGSTATGKLVWQAPQLITATRFPMKGDPVPPKPEPPNPEPPKPMPIPNHLDVVKAGRAKYASTPAGPRRGYLISNWVAWQLRAEGAGTYFKDSGTNFNDRSIDIVIYQHRDGDPAGKGATFDILGDAEGDAKPQWTRTSPTGYGNVSVWRAPTDPGDQPQPPEPPENPDNPELQEAFEKLAEAEDANRLVAVKLAETRAALEKVKTK